MGTYLLQLLGKHGTALEISDFSCKALVLELIHLLQPNPPSTAMDNIKAEKFTRSFPLFIPSHSYNKVAAL